MAVTVHGKVSDVEVEDDGTVIVHVVVSALGGSYLARVPLPFGGKQAATNSAARFPVDSHVTLTLSPDAN